MKDMNRKFLKKMLAGLLCVFMLSENNGIAAMAASSSEMTDEYI